MFSFQMPACRGFTDVYIVTRGVCKVSSQYMMHSGFFGVQQVSCNAGPCIDVCSNTCASVCLPLISNLNHMCFPCCPVTATVTVKSVPVSVTVTMCVTGTEIETGAGAGTV